MVSKRARHVRLRPRRGFRALSAASAALLAGSALTLAVGSPAWAAFPTNESIVYLAQDDDTQLKKGLQSDGAITFSDVGSPHTVAAYNAIGFNEADGYLYGVRSRNTAIAGSTPKIIRIGPAGGVTVIKDAVTGSVSGGFAATANMFYYIGIEDGTTKLFWTDVSKPAGATSSRALTGAYSTMAPDITWLGGYFWSLAADGRIHRLNISNGNVVAWTVPGLSGHGLAGGAFTYGNGNLGFVKNQGGIIQIKVSNLGTATPTFTVVSIIDGPGSNNNDAAASKGADTDLAIAKTVSSATAVRGQTLTYRLTVTNKGPGVSSGFTVSDVIPSALTIGTLPVGCTRSGQTVTCSGGRTVVDGTKSFDIPVTVSDSAARGSITNTATVLANENDPVAANNSSSVAFAVRVPAMTLDKSLVHDDDGDGVPEVGETVAYSFVVTNTGDLPLTNVQITDPLVSGITPASTSIPVGGSATFTADPVTITQDHVDAGVLANTAQADASTTGGALQATDSADLDIPAQPGLSAVKSAQLLDENGNEVGDSGEIIRYTIRVTNTGNVSLTGVGVDDALLPGLTETVDLGPGESHDFVADYEIVPADLADGQVVNTATAEGTPPSGPPVTTPPTTTTTETTRVGLTLVKSAEWDDVDGDEVVDPGETIVYTFIATNTGNVTIDDVRVEDALLADRGVAITPADGVSIPPGEQYTFVSASFTVTPDDLVDDGRVHNTAEAVGSPRGQTDPFRSPPSSTTVPLAEPEPAITLVKTASLDDVNSNGYADAGEEITYRLVVTNTGNVTVHDISVGDPMFDPADITPAGYDSLLPGAQGVFTAVHVVTQEDVDAGSVENAATAEATDPLGGPPLTDGDTVTVTTVPADPALSLAKSATLVDANGNGVADEGETIRYTFLVRNTGNVTVTGVVVEDAMFPVPAIGDLAPGEEASVSVDYTVTEDDLDEGSVDNSATASGDEPGGGTVESPPSTTTTETVAPGMTVVKRGEVGDLDGDGLAGLGEVISYTFEVTNTGNTRLTDVSIVDAMLTDISPESATLEPGGTLTFSGSYVVTEDDVIAGAISNTATATGSVPGGDPIESDPSTWEEEASPVDANLDIVKSARIVDDNGNTVADVGEHVEYSFEVRNTGNVTLTGITIADDRVSGLPAPFDLGPGESRQVVVDVYTVTQADVDRGVVSNTATAAGTGPDGPVESEPSTVELRTPPARPALTLVKSVEFTGEHNGDGLASPGETLLYTFTVTNTGNVTLAEVGIDDPMISGISSADSGPLAPGATRVFTATYEMQASDVSSPTGDGTHINTASAFAEDPSGEDVSSSEAVAAVPIADPGLMLDKSASFDDANGNGMADPGERVTYRFTVTNTGNTALTQIVIDDPMLGDPITVGSLAVGQSVTRTATYRVTEADIVAQRLVNSAQASGVVPGVPPTPIESNEDVASVPLAPDESHLTIVKEAVLEDRNGNDRADAGEVIVYRFTLTNTGTRTLTDVQVSDAQLDGLLPGPVASLAPGASVVVSSSSYTVTDSDVVRDEVRNVATAFGEGPDGPLETLPATAVVRAETPAAPVLGNTGVELRGPLAFALGAIGFGALLLALRARPQRKRA